ncbi:MAG: nitroreductase family protein [Oscillospiraceae bacterium]|nr:nitroreductase family protein [Oscillospiraceae bacterium]
MSFIELSQSRRSIRNFQRKEVAKEDLIKLITAAQSAPSAGNRQPWHFFIITDKIIQTEIKNACGNQEFMLTAPAFIVVCADIKRSEARYGDRGRHLYCIQDTAAAVQNILLCAKDLGLGTCWCGAFNESKVSEILQLQKDMRPVAIIPVGYPVSEPVPTKRRPIEEIITFKGDF